MSFYLFQGIWHLRIFPGGGDLSYRAVKGILVTEL